MDEKREVIQAQAKAYGIALKNVEAENEIQGKSGRTSGGVLKKFFNRLLEQVEMLKANDESLWHRPQRLEDEHNNHLIQTAVERATSKLAMRVEKGVAEVSRIGEQMRRLEDLMGGIQ